MFKIIACINNKFALGKNGDLLYHIKSDLQNFKRMTTNNVVIMGRKTFESLPHGALPNRINVVITSDESYEAPNCVIVNTIEAAIDYCVNEQEDKEWYVIGGSSIYNEFIKKDLVDTIYLTQVIDNVEGDVYFPNFTSDERWKLFYKSETQFNQPPYTFSIYKFKES